MASFNNLYDLFKYVNDEVIRGKGSFGKQIKKEQREAAEEYAKELQDLILQNLSKYYNSYTPTKHKRTMQQMNIFDDVALSFEYDGVEFGFGQSAMQINAVKSDPHMSFVPHLLNSGWRLKRAPESGYRGTGNRFMYFKGSFFINNAIAEFNARHASEGVVAIYK